LCVIQKLYKELYISCPSIGLFKFLPILLSQ